MPNIDRQLLPESLRKNQTYPGSESTYPDGATIVPRGA
jgi:hypothetical protein